MRKSLAIGAGLAAVLVATVALARPPGPTAAGDFYFWFKDSTYTELAGEASISCDGVYSESGKRTEFPSNGKLICPQRD